MFDGRERERGSKRASDSQTPVSKSSLRRTRMRLGLPLMLLLDERELVRGSLGGKIMATSCDGDDFDGTFRIGNGDDE